MDQEQTEEEMAARTPPASLFSSPSDPWDVFYPFVPSGKHKDILIRTSHGCDNGVISPGKAVVHHRGLRHRDHVEIPFLQHIHKSSSPGGIVLYFFIEGLLLESNPCFPQSKPVQKSH